MGRVQEHSPTFRIRPKALLNLTGSCPSRLCFEFPPILWYWLDDRKELVKRPAPIISEGSLIVCHLSLQRFAVEEIAVRIEVLIVLLLGKQQGRSSGGISVYIYPPKKSVYQRNFYMVVLLLWPGTDSISCHFARQLKFIPFKSNFPGYALESWSTPRSLD